MNAPNGGVDPLDAAPRIVDLPVGLTAAGTRRETDSMGEIDVPADRYWGAQTQRPLIHFSIGDDRMPKAVYRAYGYVKKTVAVVNGKAGRLPAWKAGLIERVADEVVAGALDEHFPLYVWQTGSGTQSNMNVNEVISNRAIQLTGGQLGSKAPVHPNDDVNLGQSSNDTFPTAMHIAAVQAIHQHLLPSVRALQHAIAAKADRWRDVVKIGRTHLEDAVPLTVGQEWSGYAHQLSQATDRLLASAEGLFELAAGGTAVGTGLNAPPGFGEQVAAEIAAATGQPHPVRGHGHGLHPGAVRGRRDRLRRVPGEFRAQRHAPGHHQQLPARRHHPGRRGHRAPASAQTGTSAITSRGCSGSGVRWAASSCVRPYGSLVRGLRC